MQAIDKINEIHKYKPNYIIEAIKIALEDSTACAEDQEGRLTIFIFLYKDGSQLTIDTMGCCKVLNTDYEYWIY